MYVCLCAIYVDMHNKHFMWPHAVNVQAFSIKKALCSTNLDLSPCLKMDLRPSSILISKVYIPQRGNHISTNQPRATSIFNSTYSDVAGAEEREEDITFMFKLVRFYINKAIGKVIICIHIKRKLIILVKNINRTHIKCVCTYITMYVCEICICIYGLALI